jgi:hypothetical protein
LFLDRLKQDIEAHLSVTIAGSNIFQLGEEQTYGLTATLRYHGSEELSSPSGALPPVTNELPPLTFKQDWSPISKLSSLTGLYRIYSVSPPDAEAIDFHGANFELLDEPKAVNTENGFICLHPNESVTREVVLVPACFDARPDTRYKIKMILGHGRIEWWGIGEIEEFRDVKVRSTELSNHGGLSIKSSNEIEVLAVEETHSAS